jgi:UDP-GlcNAc:undecaprenyl-phosphate GlcNAc-1-phosphate transferase
VTTSLIATGSVAFLLSLILVPVCARLARTLGLVDRPDNHRKIHGRVVPLAGGLAVLAAVPTTLVLIALGSPDTLAVFADNARWLGTLAAAGLIICGVGVLDDTFTLRSRQKLIGQAIAVAVLIGGGPVVVHQVAMFGTVFDLGPLAVPFTALWLLGAVNALNLLDGMDGLLGTVGGVIGLALTLLAVSEGQWAAALVALALTGALCGFLCHNRPQASVFLGDSGSMLVGLLVGALCLRAAPRGEDGIALAPLAALLVLPILDTSCAILRRKLTGRSIATCDRAHLHHSLLGAGLSPWQVLMLVAGLTALAGVGAIAAVARRDDLYALAAALSVVSLLAASRLFGHAELVLVLKRLRALVHSGADAAVGHRLEVRLQGSAGWEGLWHGLAERAEELNLQSLCLDVNVPAVHEGYHARWVRRAGPPADSLLWRAEVPLCLGPRAVGRLTVVGVRDEEPMGVKLTVLTEQAETAFPGLLPAPAPKPHLEPVRVG